ncbi:MAG TPA: hypothetical protein VHL31_17485 [Geminicoccus sp.]|jgi:hypothetical protein|nr:hypothetical protein [Geminicoccus sp.]
MPGLLVKAAAIAWSLGDDDEFTAADLKGETTDVRLACSIANDLLRMRRYRA